MNIHDCKIIWWLYFCYCTQYWGHGLTLNKLKKLESSIFLDKYLWRDLLERHNMNGVMPWDAENIDKSNYDHAIGNFAGMIYEKAVLNKLVK